MKQITSSTDLYNLSRKKGFTLERIDYKDRFPKKPTGNFIINLGSHPQNSHWVALYIERGQSPCYFDSFQKYAPNEIEDFLTQLGFTFYYSNNEDLQYIDEGYCGQFCIAFLDYMNRTRGKGKDIFKRYTDFQNQFSLTNPKANKKILAFLILI